MGFREARSRTSLRQIIQSNCFKEIVSFCQGLWKEPGNGGYDSLLWGLHYANITDKQHALVIVTSTTADRRNISFKSTAGDGPIEIIANPEPGRAVAVRVGGTDDVPVQMNGTITLHVSFAQLGPHERCPVPEGLWWFWHMVNRIVADFMGEFR